MNNTIQKPTSLIVNETKMKLVDICNQSGLPSYILEPIVKNLYSEIYMLNEQQLQQDDLAYQQALLETNKNNEDNKINEEEPK